MIITTLKMSARKRN
ncbi:hypothetical protein NN628_002573 [Escherichia coli]|nr:hypothetical protein [Escherichia coli]